MAPQSLQCPHCTTPIVPPGDDVCPSCHYNVHQELTPEQEWNLAAELEAREHAAARGPASRRDFAPSRIEQRLFLLALSAAFGCLPAGAALVTGASLTSVVILICAGVAVGCLLFMWVFAYAHAPAAAQGCAVFLVVGLILFSLVSCWLIRSREEARRNRLSNSLRKKVLEYHEKLEHEPDAAERVLQRETSFPGSAWE